MTFHPGQSGNPKGRPKGLRNKLTVTSRDALLAYIAACGPQANPFTRLVDLMLHTENEATIVACAQALADRLLPKLKAVELTAEMGPQTLDRLAQMLLALSTPEKAALQALVTTNGHAASLPLPHEE